MNLPSAPNTYSPADQAAMRTTIRQADQQNHKRGQDIEGSRLILRSSNGSRFLVTVSDAGALSATAL